MRINCLKLVKFKYMSIDMYMYMYINNFDKEVCSLVKLSILNMSKYFFLV